MLISEKAKLELTRRVSVLEGIEETFAEARREWQNKLLAARQAPLSPSSKLLLASHTSRADKRARSVEQGLQQRAGD